MSCSNLMMHHIISSSGGSTLADLQQALEDYLPVLLGLVENGKAWFSPSVHDACSFHTMCWLIAYLYYAGSHLQYKVQFVWVNQEDEAEVIPKFSMQVFLLWFEYLFVYERMLIIFSLLHFFCLLVQLTFLQETSMSNAWYEVLSVLHLMAMLLLSQANLLLLPRTSTNDHQPKVTEGE